MLLIIHSEIQKLQEVKRDWWLMLKTSLSFFFGDFLVSLGYSKYCFTYGCISIDRLIAFPFSSHLWPQYLSFQNLHICLRFTFAILIVFPLMWDFIASAPLLLRLSTFAHVTCKMVFFLEKDIKNTNQHNENKKMVSLIQGHMLFYSFMLLVCIWE